MGRRVAFSGATESRALFFGSLASVVVEEHSHGMSHAVNNCKNDLSATIVRSNVVEEPSRGMPLAGNIDTNDSGATVEAMAAPVSRARRWQR